MTSTHLPAGARHPESSGPADANPDRSSPSSDRSHGAARAGGALLRASATQLSTHYRDMLGFEWRQRRRRAESAVHTFAQLCEWDARMQACLEGFTHLERIDGLPLFDGLHEAVSEAELYALSCQASVGRHKDTLRACIGLVQALPNFKPAFSAAMQWLDWPSAEFALDLWPADDPARQALMLEAIAHHGLTGAPGEVARCVARLAETPAVQHGALRCALDSGIAEWAARAPDCTGSDDTEVRFAAAQALIVFGAEPLRHAALTVLRDLALGTSRVVMPASRELMTLGGTESHELLEALSADPPRQRQFVMALCWSGRLAHLPALIRLFDDPPVARLAGAAVSILTGSIAASDGWAVDPPHRLSASSRAQPLEGEVPDAESDRLPSADPDADLPWPDQAAFERLRVQMNLPTNDQRVIAGRPRTTEHLMRVLQAGQLATRPQAAWLLQVATRGRRLPHLAPAAHQQALMTQMTDGGPNG